MNTVISAQTDRKDLRHVPSAAQSEKKTINDLLEESAKQYADNTALKFNGIAVVYKSLHESSNKTARLLISKGVRQGDIVGLALDRSPELIVSLLAILKAGAAYLPLDPQYPKDRIEFMLQDSSAKILLTSEKYRDYFQSDADVLTAEEVWSQLDNYDETAPPVDINGDDLAYLLYTSGSTGKPKGVMIRHYNFANFLLSMQKKPGISADDKVLALTTVSFDIAGLELFLPLISGAQIVLAGSETAKDGWALLGLIRNEAVTIVQATPYTYRMLIAAGWEQPLPIKVICGGEPLPRDLAARLIPRCNALWNQYGPTETTVYSTQKLIQSADDINIGDPIDNTIVYILDEELNRVAQGAIGEIFIAGDGVAKGYLNRPELTAERFVDDRFAEVGGGKMYRTGDLGRVKANGQIECLGRIDHQVKVRGFRIEPGEIEYQLLSQPNISDAVVIVREDVAAEPRLVAYLVINGINTTDNRPLVTGLRNALKDALPAYMIPDDFVLVPTIAITPNGKVDRKALPKPDLTGGNSVQGYIAPRSEIERLVAQIWEQLMGLKNISVTDNFFRLGGHSLVAIKIMARIKKVTGKHLPLATLFENSTIEKLARRLSAGASPSLKSLVAIKPEGTKLPLYIVHGDGLNVLFLNALAMNMDAEQPVYGLQARGLEGDEDAPLPDTMEDIAAGYVAEILAQNPNGPYLLAGYSLGGYIAVEMRKQMAAMGKEVKMLIIFDTDAEKSEEKSLFYLVPRKIRKNLPLVLSAVAAFIRRPIATLAKAIKSLLTRSVAGRSPANESEIYYSQINTIKYQHHKALRKYLLTPFNDKIFLYKANVCTHYVDDKDFLGWKTYAKKGVLVYNVPGDHLSMLVSPNVEKFSVILQQSIDEYLS